MESRDRLMNTLRGKPIDRVPVWTHIPFGLEGRNFVPAPFHGQRDCDDWRKQDPAYRRLIARMETECDNLFLWRSDSMIPEHYLLPKSMLQQLPQFERDGKVVYTTVLKVAGKELRTVRAIQPGTGHMWVLEHYCKAADDARLLLDLPWKSRPSEKADFPELDEGLADRGIMIMRLLSPMCII